MLSDGKPSFSFLLVISSCGGMLLALAFAFESLAFLSLLMLVPLLWVSQVGSLRSTFFWGWYIGGIAHLGTIWWVVPTLLGTENWSLSGALLAMAFVAMAQGFQMAVFTLGAAFAFRRTRHVALATAAWWVFIEWVFPKFLPWFLADPLIHLPFLGQGADLAGVHGLAFLLVLEQGWFTQALRSKLNGDAQWRPPLRSCLAVLLLMLAYGLIREYSPERERVSRLGVGIAQSGLDLRGPDPLAESHRAFGAYERLSASPKMEAAQLVVWGETVLRVPLGTQVLWQQKVRRLAVQTNKAFLLGSIDRPIGQETEYNSAYLVRATGPAEVYRKRVLFPFFEYVPGAEYFDFAKQWPTTGLFVPGVDQGLLHFQDARMALSICFEAMMPGGQNEAVKKGANLLVNISDDIWLGDTPAPRQHLTSVRWRAIETRRYLVRSSNSGISAFIDPSGRLLHRLPFGTEGTASLSVPLLDGQTVYVRFGNWIGYVAVALLIALIGWPGLAKSDP